ncbi:GT4 family glycosyltransferase PelF [Methyloterricola oryzae]|uniref:GT4 family glycosyltransferase PelF n=1 Tax=Methyloterricola oryzae TaxID=1495050 RepID=UPI0005EB3743|nr:GT4 family glycosyltransferase PelF [Methyloterricola oryzae]
MKGSNPIADITLVLEGTYPFMNGGVSHWVHQLISGLPQFTFSLIFLGSTEESYSGLRFRLPDNVTHLQCFYLWGNEEFETPRERSGNVDNFAVVEHLHDWFRSKGDFCTAPVIGHFLRELANPKGRAIADFYFSNSAWHFICQRYSESKCRHASFADYFWTVRMMHAPLLKLARGAASIPRGRVVHSVSNGYAGFLAVVLKQLQEIPFMLTEHGIYSKERKIDLQSSYIEDCDDLFSDPPPHGMQEHRYMWIRHFEGLSRFVYSEANPILSCHEGNRRRQVKDGAADERTHVIPNGINLTNYVALRSKRPEKIPMVLGLIGRMVPIKDIKTFIRAMRVVATRLPAAEGWLIGPEAEDPKYGDECRQLVANLGLEANVRFLGFQDLDTIFPQLGLLVLTSISEAFPLVLLEAFATGVPVLTTNVGACREIIEGNTAEDKALGSAGSVVPIADPEATAEAAIALLTDETRWKAAQRTAIERVERYYSEPRFLGAYGEVYQAALGD